jgi:hypothetical protein
MGAAAGFRLSHRHGVNVRPSGTPAAGQAPELAGSVGGGTECASPWRQDGRGVMCSCPFRIPSVIFLFFFSLFFLALLFLDGWRWWWNRAAAGSIEKSGRPQEETGANLNVFELLMMTKQRGGSD